MASKKPAKPAPKKNLKSAKKVKAEKSVDLLKVPAVQ